MSLTFRRLVASDEAAVRGWLEPYLVEHVGWWLEARGVDGDAATLVRERRLVDRDWDELVAAAATDFVAVAERGGRPVGIVRAAVREDRHLHLDGGVLQWLAVDRSARGEGVATALVARAGAWFDARGVSSEVFVTDANAAAVRAYETAGFRRVDARLVRPRAR